MRILLTPCPACPGRRYGIAVLLWLLLALLLRGTAALPAVLMVAGGLAVVLRQRARAQEGRHLIRMPLDKSLEVRHFCCIYPQDVGTPSLSAPLPPSHLLGFLICVT